MTLGGVDGSSRPRAEGLDTGRFVLRFPGSPHGPGDRCAARLRPRRTSVALPYPAVPGLDDQLLTWLEPFVASKRNARADLPAVGDQTRDYRQKIHAIATAFAEAHRSAMRIADLFGPAPDQVLRARRDPRTGAPLRAASRNSYRRVLNSFVSWLKLQGLDSTRVIPWQMEGEGEPHLRTFEPEDIERIFWHLAERDSVDHRRMTAIIAMSLDSGSRRGDVLSMRMSTIDLGLRRATLWVKNDKHIDVPLGPLAVKALRRYLEVRVPDYGHDLVFLNAAGTKPITGDGVSRAFRRILLRLGIVSPQASRSSEGVTASPERLNLHALRRTFVKHYLAAGRSERELAAIVGWHPDYAHKVAERYHRVSIEQLQSVHEVSSPLSRLLRSAA